MAMEAVSEADRRYFKDNLLMNEDWDSDLARMDDLSSLLDHVDIESSLMADELMQQLPDDLELAMPQHQGLSQGIEDPFRDFSDGSDSGVDMYSQTKSEPLSPASSQCSDGSTDCLQTNVPIDMTMAPHDGKDLLSQAFPLDSDFCLPMDLSDSDIRLDSNCIKLESQDLNDTLVSEDMLSSMPMDTFAIENLTASHNTVSTLKTNVLTSRITTLPDGTVIKVETPDTPPHTPPRDNIIAPKSGTSVIRTIPVSSTSSLRPGTRLVTTSSGMKIVLQAPPAGKQGIKRPSGVSLVTSAQGVAAKNGTAITLPSGPAVAVAQVLQNKIKIQPKPLLSPESPTGPPPAKKATGSNMPQGKALVLTPEEFAKLTAQGVLKFQQPAASTASTPSTPATPSYRPAPPATPTPPVKTIVTPQVSRATTPAFSVCGMPHVDTDVKQMKRQQRMMKNRESACLSRKRKKEYMQTLEEKLQESADENRKLKHQNDCLKKKIEQLMSENQNLRKPTPMGAVKKVTTVLLGVLLMLSLNLGPVSNILSSSKGDLSSRLEAAMPASIHHGRTLMSYDYDADDFQSPDSNLLYKANPVENDTVERVINQLRKSMHLTREGVSAEYEGLGSTAKGQLSRDLMLIKQVEAAMCPTYFNSTESQRLMNELRGWVLGHEQVMKQTQEKDQKQGESKKKQRRTSKKYNPPRKMKAAMKEQQISPELYSQTGDGIEPYEVQVFSGSDQQYRNFLGAIQRRNDTFYVVSFRNDHLLLPATAHNKTMRPLMSLVMPSMGLNDSMQPPPGSIAMMQIDCEVRATKLIHIHKSKVPGNTPPNATSDSPEKTDDPLFVDQQPTKRKHKFDRAKFDRDVN